MSSSLGRRLLQRPAAAIQRTNALVGGRSAAAAISTIANDSSSLIHHRSNDHICNLPTAARVFSSAAEEYHPEPRPFKKIMAGKQHNAKIRKQKICRLQKICRHCLLANIYTIIVRLTNSCISCEYRTCLPVRQLNIHTHIYLICLLVRLF